MGDKVLLRWRCFITPKKLKNTVFADLTIHRPAKLGDG